MTSLFETRIGTPRRCAYLGNNAGNASICIWKKNYRISQKMMDGLHLTVQEGGRSVRKEREREEKKR